MTGTYVRIYGDPRGGKGKPRYVHTLRTESGEELRLRFDDDVYKPMPGLGSFNRRPVRVEGTLQRDGSLLVKSIERQ